MKALPPDQLPLLALKAARGFFMFASSTIKRRGPKTAPLQTELKAAVDIQGAGVQGAPPAH